MSFDFHLCPQSYSSSPPSSSSSPGPSLSSFPSLPSPSPSLDCAVDLGRGANFPGDERQAHASLIRLGRSCALHPHWLVVFLNGLDAVEIVAGMIWLRLCNGVCAQSDTKWRSKFRLCIVYEFEGQGETLWLLKTKEQKYLTTKQSGWKQHTKDNITWYYIKRSATLIAFT